MDNDLYSVSTDAAWFQALKNIMDNGVEVNPRGKPTIEVPAVQVRVLMTRPVLTNPVRKLNYRFMAGEAWWILTGDNRVSTIEPYNKHIAKFSDNGETFAGAYGPMVVSQLKYVTDKLIADPASRQAGMTIWRPNPAPSLDIPCTVALFFHLRFGQINCHVFMRSSDVWLGLPYDIFNFSMISCLVASALNARKDPATACSPGTLYLTLCSSHMYEENRWPAESLMEKTAGNIFGNDYQVPERYWTDQDYLTESLDALAKSSPGDSIRWWEAR